MLAKNEEPRSKQATLASLAPLKMQLKEKLKQGTSLSSKELTETVCKLMRLVNVDDEPLFHELVSGYLFNPEKKIAGVTLDGHQALVLFNFFLGYCQSEK